MKTKTIISFILSLSFYILSSQVPQGFNYQAIARDGSGNPISTPIDVRIAILTSESDLDVIWEEEHTGVDPDEHGLFSIVVGDGTTLAGGLAGFSLIDWTETPLYIRTKINDVKMGIAQLWSVPYSMISGDLGGSVKKLEVMGEDETSDEALFEVKRKDGELMFGVYNHGVRINMPLDTLSKTRKGGFIIAGFDSDKGIVQDYFVVNPDSIRAYIDTNPIKTRKGGFAVGGFDAAKQDIQDYLLVSPDSVRVFLKETDAKTRKGGFAISGYDNAKGITNDYFNVDIDTNSIIDPSENRILWYPLKNAFLTGKVLIEDKDSVGENSFESGYESKAIGNYSQALGYKAIARSDYSTAIGKNAVADSINSFAFGDSARARNDESYAFGRGAIAKGYRSFAFGSAGVDSAGAVTGVAYAKGDYSFAIGQGSQSLGKGAFAFGLADTAKGTYSIAIGYKASAKENGTISIGNETTASGNLSTALGINTIASGRWSTAIGYRTTASGFESTAIGSEVTASGDHSTAMGYMAKATGWYSTAMGNNTIASGWFSTTWGIATIASGWYSTALGSATEAIGDNAFATGVATRSRGFSSTSMGFNSYAKPTSSLAIGQYNDSTCSASGTYTWISTDPLFVAGNGSEGSLSNALTLYKNGNLTIAGTLTQNSDLRLKEDMLPLNNGIDFVKKINPVYFYFKDKNRHPSDRQLGFIAQEIDEILPELVKKDGQGFLSVDYSKISVVLLQAIKEQQQQIESYKSENDNLKSQLQSLQKEVEQIKILLAITGEK